MVRTLNADTIDEAIQQIYARAADTAHWHEVVSDVQRAVGTDYVNVIKMQPDRLIVDGASAGLPESERRRYLTEWAPSDIIVNALMHRPLRKPEQAFTIEDLVSWPDLRASAIYEGFYEPNGIIYQCCAAFAVGNGIYGGLSIQNGHRSGEIPPQKVRLLERLAGHLRIAMQIAEQIQALAVRARTAERAIGHWGVVLARCLRDGYVLAASGDLLGILRRFRPYVRLTHGRLHPVDPSVRQRWQRLLADPATAARGRAPVLTLTPPGCCPCLECTVLPGDVSNATLASDERLVLLRVGDQAPVIDDEILRYRLGVTPTEARVLARLMSGERLQGIAEQRGTTMETVRSNLRALRKKLGCHTQGQLIARGWQAVGFLPGSRIAPRSNGAGN